MQIIVSTALLLAAAIGPATGTGCAIPAALQLPSELEDSDLEAGWLRKGAAESGDFAEQLVIRGPLDGGGGVYIKVQITNLATADGRATFQGNITLPDGRKLKSKRTRNRGEWDAEAGSFNVSVDTSAIDLEVGDGEVRFEGDDFRFEGEFSSRHPALRPEGGLVDRGGAYYITTLVMARGTIEGTLTLLGEAGSDGGDEGGRAILSEQQLNGIVYGEHRAGVIPPWKMARSWTNVLEIGPKRTVVMSAFERADGLGDGTQGWLFVADDVGVQVYQPSIQVRGSDVIHHEKSGYNYPRVVYVADEDNGAFRGVFEGLEEAKVKDDLSNLSSIERFVVKRIMSPWTFTWRRADYLLKVKDPTGVERPTKGKAMLRYQQLK